MQVPFFSPVPEVTVEDATITDPRKREKAFGQDDHVRKFGRDYPKRIEHSGLKAVTDDFAKTVDASRFGISASEVIYIGCKE